MAKDPEELNKYIKLCIGIFVSLMVLTLVTVAVSYLELDSVAAIAVALAIALIKGTLVASYFMHLYQEKTYIYWSLALTVFFFAALMLLPVMTNMNEFSQWVQITH